MFSKILIVSPHADDEVFGCFNYLLKSKRKHINLHVAYQAIGVKWQSRMLQLPKESFNERIKAVEKMCFEYDFSISIMFRDKDSLMDSINTREVVQKYEKLFNQESWNTIIIPCKTFHHDHTIANQCSMAALRRNYHSSIYVYEYIYPHGFDNTFTPNKFIPLNQMEMEEKVGCLRTIYSDFINDEHDIKSIRFLNATRGVQINREYAEAFQVIREVE